MHHLSLNKEKNIPYFRENRIKKHELKLSDDSLFTKVPKDFDWKKYLELNPKINTERINTKQKAVRPWIRKGQNANFKYK